MSLCWVYQGAQVPLELLGPSVVPGSGSNERRADDHTVLGDELGTRMEGVFGRALGHVSHQIHVAEQAVNSRRLITKSLPGEAHNSNL